MKGYVLYHNLQSLLRPFPRQIIFIAVMKVFALQNKKLFFAVLFELSENWKFSMHWDGLFAKGQTPSNLHSWLYWWNAPFWVWMKDLQERGCESRKPNPPKLWPVQELFWCKNPQSRLWCEGTKSFFETLFAFTTHEAIVESFHFSWCVVFLGWKGKDENSSIWAERRYSRVDNELWDTVFFCVTEGIRRKNPCKKECRQKQFQKKRFCRHLFYLETINFFKATFKSSRVKRYISKSLLIIS